MERLSDRRAEPATLPGGGDSPTARLIDDLIAEAVRRGATHVHFEARAGDLVVRMRIGGALRETLRMPQGASAAIIGRIKALARLDPTAPVAQEGRLAFVVDGMPIDLAVSTLPGSAGERLVLRLLPRVEPGHDLGLLGMPPAVARLYRDALAEPDGIVLVAGPAGSGRTTTLYAGLKLLADGSRNILSVETPVAEAIEGVGQTEVDHAAGNSFADGLRAVLRQDPDVIMVGEIGDPETAGLVVQAALAGHLLLSTVPADDAVGAILALRGLGIEAPRIAATLRAVVAQRLLRRLCGACRAPVEASGSTAALLGFDSGTTIHEPRGCRACGGTGYAGRVGVFEAVRIDAPLRQLIDCGGDAAVIANQAFRNAPSLGAAARALVRDGTASAEDVIRLSRGECPNPPRDP